MENKKTLLQRIRKIAPLYALLPGLVCIAFNVIVYNGNRLLTNGWDHYDLSNPHDSMITFLRWTVIFYVLFFPYLAVGYLGIVREGKKAFYRLATANLIAKAVCLVIFLLLPTFMPDWPSGTFEIRNFFDWLLQFVYDHDEPNDLFPSIHCLESWLVMRATCSGKHLPKPYKVVIAVAAVCIMLSTLTTKQHLVVDMAGGIFLAEAGLFLSAKLRGERLFEKLEALFTRKEPTAV
ncbi:MAG: phosphatase PAP2 family protein [Clostridiales bacterium]|nr:phosphatase PAP2 family protein [Candidatus Coliplasma caballi]